MVRWATPLRGDSHVTHRRPPSHTDRLRTKAFLSEGQKSFTEHGNAIPPSMAMPSLVETVCLIRSLTAAYGRLHNGLSWCGQIRTIGALRVPFWGQRAHVIRTLFHWGSTLGSGGSKIAHFVLSTPHSAGLVKQATDPRCYSILDYRAQLGSNPKAARLQLGESSCACVQFMRQFVKTLAMSSVPYTILTVNTCRRRTSTHDGAECGRGRRAW
eukprot:360804-Chlamydomonas_euryale.AAC.3